MPETNNQIETKPSSSKTGPKSEWKLTPETVKKLEEAFAIDSTVEEACFYADISRQTYYQWIKAHPKLADRFEALRENPILKARQTIAKSLDDPNIARWYLEKKKRKEFGNSLDLTSDGEKLTGIQVTIVKNEARFEGDSSVREELPSQNQISGEPGGNPQQQDILAGATVRGEIAGGEAQAVHDLPQDRPGPEGNGDAGLPGHPESA